MDLPDYDPAAAAQGWLHALAGTLTHAASPFWWPSLLAAGAAAVVAVLIAGARLRDVPRHLLPARAALLRELPVDLACWLGSTALPFFLAPLFLALSWAGMLGGLLVLQPLFGMPDPQAPAPGMAILALAAGCAFVCGDFMLYWTHRLFHRVPLLWRMHRLHHAPPVLTPLTAFRFWPQEHLVHLSGNVLGQGFGLGLVMAAAGGSVSALTLFGVNIVALAWGMAFAHLRHSHVPLGFPRTLSYLLVSPHMHQAHHSVDRAHHDRNFGTALALWDWLFGTLHIPGRADRFRFGTAERMDTEIHAAAEESTAVAAASTGGDAGGGAGWFGARGSRGGPAAR